MPRDVVFQPICCGPRKAAPMSGPRCSCPSLLRMGTNTKSTSSSRSSLPRCAISRSSIRPASLPSISPPWMPACASTTGLPGLPLRARTSSRSRPSLVLPNTSSDSSGEAATSRCNHARVCASLGVLTKSLRSAGVIHGSSGDTINASLAPCHARTGGNGALVSMVCASSWAAANSAMASTLALRRVLRAMLQALA